MEVRLSSLADVQLAVVSRFRCEQLIVSRRAELVYLVDALGSGLGLWSGL